MKTTAQRNRYPWLLSVLLAAAGLVAAAPATPAMAKSETGASRQTMLPQEMQYGGIHYLTGGAGTGEAKAFKEAMQRYSLAIELIERQKGSKHGAYTADAMVRISDHADKEIFNARAKGPFMLVQLEPGKYSMSATLNDHTPHKGDVMVEKGKTTHETFVFPYGTD